MSYLPMSLQFGENDVSVGWLPLFHDMGLVTQILMPLLIGARSVVLTPAHWVRRPSTLLRAVHRHQGTMTWMPNFAFNHCVRYIRDEELEGCDLASWQILGSGSEPVQWDTLQAFATRFASYGFNPAALMVGYGMAENVVGVSNTPSSSFPRREWVSVKEECGVLRAESVPDDTDGARLVVSCGLIFRGTRAAILDDEGNVLPDRHIGEIALQSSSLFSGYHQQPGLTEQVLRDGWYHTGDLGYLADGELYVYERKSDIIIVGGQNIRPYDIEQAARSIMDGKGEVVAFGVADPLLGTESPIVVCESRGRLADEEQRAIKRQIRQAVLQALDIVLGDVRLVPRGWVIKTTSGKIARSANQKKYLDEQVR